MSVAGTIRTLSLLFLALIVDYHLPRSEAAAEIQAAKADDSEMSCHGAPPIPETVHLTEFERDVLPIVKQCTPCHFPGGSMYARLPFDKPETIHHLGEKLFSRLKKDEEREVIRRFLASAPQVASKTTSPDAMD